MSYATQKADWNVLTSPWLEAMTEKADSQVYSPLEALNRASAIRCIAMANPLDQFAAYRFLLTLLYWKADKVGGVDQVRASLLNGELPRDVFDAIQAESHCFRIFDDKSPFLQDTSASNQKEKKSVGSLFAEFASGTNVAHFHHGDDENMRLCVRCVTIGMLRVVPWTQAGGSGLTPSIHGAPPIMAIAYGENLAITLGLNLVPLGGEAGEAKWTGHFEPADTNSPVPYLEALTWNARRIHLPPPKGEGEGEGICWGCGCGDMAAIGPIVYLKNEYTKKRSDKKPFTWQDPAAFYAADTPYKTMKSGVDKKKKEPMAASGRDLDWLRKEENAPTSAIVAANPNHEGWHMVIPCTNPADNKTFDHRQLDLPRLSPDAIPPAEQPAAGPKGLDGWREPRRAAHAEGPARFVQAAVRLLTDGDWAALSAATYKEMNLAPAAFDVLSGLLWPLRRTVKGLPSKNAAWLLLKLMAAVPPYARVYRADATFSPLAMLPKQQIPERRKDGSVRYRYPVSLPRGQRLEANLRSALEKNMRSRTPEAIDWPGLCQSLDQLLD